MNPCDECNVKYEQTILCDEVNCFRTCKDWLEWKGKERGTSRPDGSAGHGAKEYIESYVGEFSS